MVACVISNSSRAFVLLGSFSKFKNVIASSIGHISRLAFTMSSEKVDSPVDVAKSFLCFLNLILKFLLVLHN